VNHALDGLRVIDLSIGVAGPYATRQLADLGVDLVTASSACRPQSRTAQSLPLGV